MKYVYPAIFTPLDNDDRYDVHVPDLPYVHTYFQVSCRTHLNLT